MATTDVHGRLMDWDYERDQVAPLGLVRVATVVDSLRRAYGRERVFLVDAGDLIQGNPFASYFARVAPAPVHPIIAAMNRIGYDVATPGNHEFNFGLATLQRAARGARFRYVSANIERANGTPLFPRSTVVTRGGVKVGFSGVTTPGVMVWDGLTLGGSVRLLDVAEAGPPALRALREGGADVTVLIAHAGLRGASSYDERRAPPEHNVAALLAAVPETDVAVIGHTHGEIADSTIGRTLVVQPRNWAQSVAVAELVLARVDNRWAVIGKRGRIVRLDGVRADPAAVAAARPAHTAARAWSTRAVGTASVAMSAARARLEDTPVVDFINAVQMAKSGAELSASPAFNTRGGLPAGPVSRGDIASIYPYENTLVSLRISGADLRAFLEHASRFYAGVGADGQPVVNDAVPGYNFDIVSGADYELDLAQPVGRRVVQLMVRGQDVRDTDSFTVALNSYRAQGGGGYSMLARAPRVYDRSEDVRGLLADEIARRGSIRPEDYFVQNWRLRTVPGVRADGRTGVRDSIVLRVMGTNDVHGRLLSRVESWSESRPVGGAAAIAGMMNRLADECACPSVRVDAGDLMQGTPISNLSFGRATVDAANAMGYAAIAIGNHEFDWTVDTLVARMAHSRFTWVSANTIELRTRRPPAWAAPYRIVNAGALRVAIVGFTALSTSTSTNPLHVAHLGFRGAPALDSAIAAARRERVDAVVVVAHEGAFCQREVCQGEIVNIAGALQNRPDVIMSGHTHSLVNTVINGIPIVQARSNGTSLAVVDLVVSGGARTSRARVETVWADRERPDTAVARIVDAYEVATRSQVTRRIAELARAPLTRDSGLGELLADALRAHAGADVALINLSGVRSSLGNNTITWGDLYEVLPFGNRVVRLAATGAVLRRAVEHSLSGNEPRVAISGMRVTFAPGRPVGERVVTMTLDNGLPVADDARYSLATLDFLSVGGSGFAMLRDAPRTATLELDIDAVAAYLQSLPQPVRFTRGAARMSSLSP